jgi:hypothetical protein
VNQSVRDLLRKELTSRGFSIDGAAPYDTMDLPNDLLDELEIADLLDRMVTRREKVFFSSNVVGEEAAKKSYEDVVKAIDSIKAFIARMALML